MALSATGTGTPDNQRSYVDWPAIFAGAFVAASISVLLTTFGTAIGLTIISPFEGRGVSGPMVLIAIGLWTLWVAGSSNMAGGYVAGRMRRRVHDATEHESDVRDSIHGFVVWAVAALFVAGIAAMTAAGVMKTGAQAGASVVSGIAKGAGQAASSAVQQSNADPLDYITNQMMRPGAQGGGAANGVGVDRDQVAEVLRHGMSEGQLSDDDKNYLAQAISQQTGLSPEEARARVDTAIQQAQAAEQKAREAAEKARKAAVISAFVVAVSLLVGAAAASWGATMGGRHRDEETDLSYYFPRRT